MIAVDVDDEPEDGPSGPESELRARQNPISIAHVARTPESDTASEAEAQAPDQGKEGGLATQLAGQGRKSHSDRSLPRLAPTFAHRLRRL
jgi:hypothetical protein